MFFVSPSSRGQEPVRQQSLTFWARGVGFMEDSFSTDPSRVLGAVVFRQQPERWERLGCTPALVCSLGIGGSSSSSLSVLQKCYFSVF